MDIYEGNYPPNPTGMEEEKYREGVNLLYSLLNTEGEPDDPDVTHINTVLNSTGVDAALYLLYYGHRVKEEIYGLSKNEFHNQKEFKTLLQTAVSIGAFMSRNKLMVLDKFDKMWDVPYQGEEDSV